MSVFTYHFSGPGRAVGAVCVCVGVCGQQLLNDMTFEIDSSRADSS